MLVTASVGKKQEQRKTLSLVLTLVGLLNDLNSVCDQIFISPTIPTIDEVFSRLLHLDASAFT